MKITAPRYSNTLPLKERLAEALVDVAQNTQHLLNYGVFKGEDDDGNITDFIQNVYELAAKAKEGDFDKVAAEEELDDLRDHLRKLGLFTSSMATGHLEALEATEGGLGDVINEADDIIDRIFGYA